MARRKEHLALLNVAFLVQLACIRHALTVTPYCSFNESVNSTAYNNLQDVTLEDCIVNTNGDQGNITICNQPHSSTPKAVSHRCLCGGHEILKTSDLECNLNDCCESGIWICHNNGSLDSCKPGSFKCKCSGQFHGIRCHLVYVTRKCSITSIDRLMNLKSCKSVGESRYPCLHTVNNNHFHCGIPVPPREVSGLTECSQMSEGDPVISDPVTVGPVTNGQWSTWSQWSVCSMSEDTMSVGPCMCRKRECVDGNCKGTDMEVSNCTVVTPEHGHWTGWTPWSACSSTRGRSGKRTRHRFCSNPAPKNDGRSCDGKSEATDVETERCVHDCPVSGSELKMTEFSSWANMTFDDEIPGWLRVRTKLVCQTPRSELAEISGEEVADACYLLKVSVEHCYKNRCAPLKGLRKLIDNTSVSGRYRPAKTVVDP